MFVHPHPAFGMLADGFFKVIPNLLGDCRDVICGRGADGAEDLNPVSAILPGDADTGDNGKAQSLGQSHMEGGYTGFQTETLDDCGGSTGFDVQIGQESGMALTLEAFHQAQHGPLLRDDNMP